MTIIYTSFEELHVGIAILVREGIQFEADADTLTVTLTGGY